MHFYYKIIAGEKLAHVAPTNLCGIHYALRFISSYTYTCKYMVYNPFLIPFKHKNHVLKIVSLTYANIPETRLRWLRNFIHDGKFESSSC